MTPEQLLQPMMNGSDKDVMDGLRAMLNHPTSTDIWRMYASELWTRGITKDQFLEWINASNGTK